MSLLVAALHNAVVFAILLSISQVLIVLHHCLQLALLLELLLVHLAPSLVRRLKFSLLLQVQSLCVHGLIQLFNLPLPFCFLWGQQFGVQRRR
jgi:hypothetical protein